MVKSEQGLKPIMIENNNKTQSVAEILKNFPGGCTLFMLRVYEDDVAISDKWTHVVTKKAAPIKTRHPLPSKNDPPQDFFQAWTQIPRSLMALIRDHKYLWGFKSRRVP